MNNSFHNQRIVILGLARQGRALARFFVQMGARVVISDVAPAAKLRNQLEQIGDLPVEFALGGHPVTLLDDCDLLCLSGGVPPQIDIVQQAIARGIPLSNDSLLTLQLARARDLGPIIAITGSSGKTTTTTLVDEMLAESDFSVHVGGNIGTPLIDRLDKIEPGEPVVLELSSFQLELFDPTLTRRPLDAIGPDVAAILNITPNHLDRHPSMAAYADAKLNLLRHLPDHAAIVLSADDPVTARLAAGDERATTPPVPAAWKLDPVLNAVQSQLAERPHTVIPFSRTRPLASGAWQADETLFYNDEPICARTDLQLRGDHNVSNVLAAMASSGAAGATPAAMRAVAQRFAGVPHRLEVVAEMPGALWINDSIATSPERALAALRSFPAGEQTLILLVGGKDKNLPWDALADEALRRVDHLIGFGEVGPMVVRLVQERAQFERVKTPSSAVVAGLAQAVELAARIAMPSTAMPVIAGVAATTIVTPTVVLLSPGGTSYDSYRDFEARGEHFRQLVAAQIERVAQDVAHP